MSYHVAHRYGAISPISGIRLFLQLLAELIARLEDEGHGDFAVNLSRTVIFENLVKSRSDDTL
ncbi:hypothetical protein SAMN05216247_102487 [Pseudomonas salomonii]|jgi:hypothetical protein|uniref:Uncharacterized protein n=1 Tax=Pseudomonas salomonii TaxID=191391 RepID=A0A1H3GMY0_9PSED|nr:hypothetical protein SAMN05216247_102487 [Pseudomonas salomonii]